MDITDSLKMKPSEEMVQFSQSSSGTHQKPVWFPTTLHGSLATPLYRLPQSQGFQVPQLWGSPPGRLQWSHHSMLLFVPNWNEIKCQDIEILYKMESAVCTPVLRISPVWDTQSG